MSAADLDRLSERQRECLRLVHANLEAKEIAARLGLSPHTVNEHLRDARRVLRVPRSIQAARLLIEHERDNRIVPEPIGVELAPDHGDAGDAISPAAPARIVRKNRYNLGILTRVGLIVAIALGAVALAGALLVGAEAISRIFRAEQVDISDPPYRQ